MTKYIPHYSVAEYQQWGGEWELWQGIHSRRNDTVSIWLTPEAGGANRTEITVHEKFNR